MTESEARAGGMLGHV